MPLRTEKEERYEYSRLSKSLADIPLFVSSHAQLTYIEFDYYTVHDLTLFSVEPSFDFNSFEAAINRISSSLGAVKRVFSKPFIVLKDSAEVLPVEVVTKINQDSLVYLGNHMNDVDDITSKGIKPRRLLTQVYDDDYGIYENLIFCDYVDASIRYCRKNMRTLKQLVYVSETMNFNLLERVNHLDYYLALGKLHTGYIRDFSKYYVRSKELYKKATYILNTLRARLIKPVYKNNRHRSEGLALKKTNIFLMQKDYRQVFLSYKYLLSHAELKDEDVHDIDMDKLQRNYFIYVEILIIFALGHFNFKTSSNLKMNLAFFDSSFSFKSWRIRLTSMAGNALSLRVKKDKEYRFILVPSISFDYSSAKEKAQKRYKCDEVVVCSPFEEDYAASGSMLISIENLDSFRRLQQLFLKGMIYSDAVHHDCPFCKDSLTYDSSNASYLCENCRTLIRKKTCSKTGKEYYTTEIYNLPLKEIDPSSYSLDDRWLYNQAVESAMFYRNITKIDNKGRLICPECGKTHEKS